MPMMCKVANIGRWNVLDLVLDSLAYCFYSILIWKLREFYDTLETFLILAHCCMVNVTMARVIAAKTIVAIM